ncbi:MAG TPA: hypothetical protein VK335_08415 [Bryobacteraceae bacterium]|nr:hypothetical protein [Bryobacteraceae bacterium]HXR15928.1 hypothetical protein [Terriglobales bacterium]HZW96135.1 hypothetical protein [Candidatus Eremiobacteraceae bacterium]
MDISPETLDRIADRFTDLAAQVFAVQEVLFERHLTTEEDLGRIVDKWRAIVANQPSERAWREALRGHQGGG